jgi:hypothetical protein
MLQTLTVAVLAQHAEPRQAANQHKKRHATDVQRQEPAVCDKTNAVTGNKAGNATQHKTYWG